MTHLATTCRSGEPASSICECNVEAATGADGLGANVKRLSGDGSIKTWAESAAMGAYVVDAFDGVVRATELRQSSRRSCCRDEALFTDGPQRREQLAMLRLRNRCDPSEAAVLRQACEAIRARQCRCHQAGPPEWLKTRPTIQARQARHDKSVSISSSRRCSVHHV